MPDLFEITTLKSMKLSNRIVRSATWEGMCEQNGRPTQKLIDYYVTLAKGGIGLIVSGYTFVRPEGKQLKGKMGIHTDDFAPDYEKLTKAVHAAGGTIAIQLVHAGGQANTEISGHTSVAPSAIETAQFPVVPDALDHSQILTIIEAFADGARRAKAWGFDGIQLHGAHGYLINQFLSPLTNRRTDEYGGSIDSRCRFMLQVYEKVRKTVGNDFPVMIKLNATDHLEGGLSLEDALVAAQQLDAAGIDAIEVSSGTKASGSSGPVREKINTPEKEGYNLAIACKLKENVSCPVMTVGGYRSFSVAQKAIKENGMDYISMCRPLIRQPDLPNRWQQGDITSATCVSCNKCYLPGMNEGGIYCVVEKKAQKRKNKS